MVEDITIINLDTSAELQIAATTTPWFILDKVDWGVVSATHNTTRFVGQIGETKVSSLLGTRVIKFTGWVIAATLSLMESRKNYLNMFFNPVNDYCIIYGKYKLNINIDDTIRWGEEYATNNDIMCKFSISGIAYDPLFKDKDGATIFSTSVYGLWTFPWTIPIANQIRNNRFVFGYRRSFSIFSLTNKGQIEIGMIVRFRFTDTVVNPTLVNNKTGEYIKFNKTVNGEEVIEVNTNKGQRYVYGYINGVGPVNYFGYRDIRSSWIQLPVGDSSFQYTADSGYEYMEIEIEYNNSYLEVQTL